MNTKTPRKLGDIMPYSDKITFIGLALKCLIQSQLQLSSLRFHFDGWEPSLSYLKV